MARVTLPDGRRSKGTARAKAEALVELRKLRAAVADGFRADRRTTVAEWLGEWGSTVLPGRVGSRTVENYRTVAAHHLVPHVGAIRLTALRIEDVEAGLAAVAAKGYSRSPSIVPAPCWCSPSPKQNAVGT